MAATSAGGGLKSPKGFKITSASSRSTSPRSGGTASVNGLPIF